MTTGYYHSNVLPWTIVPEEVARFKKIVRIVLVVFLVLGLIVPAINVPKVDRSKQQELPPRLAKLILEKQKPKPKPVFKAPEKKKEEKKEKKKEKKKVEKKKKPEKKVEKKKPEKKKVDVAKAREKAAKSGLLAMMDDLSDLRDKPVIPKKVKIKKNVAKARKAEEPNLLALNSDIKGSGGISSAALKRATTQSRELGDRQGTEIDSPVEASAAEAFADASAAERSSPRTLEEIQQVFDRYKGAITRMYNRALRKDPTLKGVVTLEITIAPDGTVTACKAVSSDLDAPDMVRKLVARVKTFKFKAKDVDTVTIRYPVDFTPIN